MRTAVSRLISLSCDVIECVGDIPALFDAVVRLEPDVVLLDLSLPGGLNGLEACRRLKATSPGVHVVVFTAHDEADLRRSAHDAGASAFVWKLEAATDLLATIHAVADGTARSAGSGS